MTIVRPDTLVRWHRDLYRLFWRAKSKTRGRPRIPADLQRLIADIAAANRTWGVASPPSGASLPISDSAAYIITTG